jgi:hypothetical protein
MHTRLPLSWSSRPRFPPLLKVRCCPAVCLSTRLCSPLWINLFSKANSCQSESVLSRNWSQMPNCHFSPIIIVLLSKSLLSNAPIVQCMILMANYCYCNIFFRKPIAIVIFWQSLRLSLCTSVSFYLTMICMYLCVNSECFYSCRNKVNTAHEPIHSCALFAITCYHVPGWYGLWSWLMYIFARCSCSLQQVW